MAEVYTRPVFPLVEFEWNLLSSNGEQSESDPFLISGVVIEGFPLGRVGPPGSACFLVRQGAHDVATAEVDALATVHQVRDADEALATPQLAVRAGVPHPVELFCAESSFERPFKAGAHLLPVFGVRIGSAFVWARDEPVEVLVDDPTDGLLGAFMVRISLLPREVRFVPAP